MYKLKSEDLFWADDGGQCLVETTAALAVVTVRLATMAGLLGVWVPYLLPRSDREVVNRDRAIWFLAATVRGETKSRTSKSS
jgi:hypothetical protein